MVNLCQLLRINEAKLGKTMMQKKVESIVPLPSVSISKRLHSCEDVFTREIHEGLTRVGEKPTITPNTSDIIPQEKLKKLVDERLSLHQMARELNKPVTTIRSYLEKYNIASEAQQEFRILKEYFSATTSESKAKAFDSVDKYLQQIAKDEFKLSKGTTYEDCLQDVRLRFFEEVEKSQKDGVAFPTSILRKVKDSAPELEQEFQTTGLEALEKMGIEPAIEDSAIRAFEDKGYRLGHNLILSNNFLYDRDAAILDRYFIKGQSLEKISNDFGYSTGRVREIKNKALDRLKEKLAPYKDRLW